MRRRTILVLVALVAGLLATTPGAADDARDDRSKNLEQIAQVPIKIGAKLLAAGSDLAFQNDLLVAGTYEGLGFFRILEDKPYVKQLSFHNCPASQGDVSVWGDLVVVSVDSTSSNSGKSAVCNNTNDSQEKEGLRLVDISNPRSPRQVGFVETDCGSHTHTVVPGDKDTLYAYVLSYPLGAQTESCNVVTHRKISVVEIPLGDPAKAKVATTPEVTTTIGCHDVTVFPAKDLAAAACITEAQMWNIKNPRKPEIIARVFNPAVNIWHSAAVTWDGKYAAFGDEFAGSVTGVCPGVQGGTVGAMWFYDIRDPTSPELVGHHAVPRPNPAPASPEEAAYVKCTTHNFNIVPMKHDDHYVAVSGYRSAGMSIVDFSHPGHVRELAHHVEGTRLPDVWSAYWYNGRIYTNDNASQLGIGVFEVRGLGRSDTHYFRGRLNPQVQLTGFK
jgi:hypothetical protein